jgi:hypothetical protein
MAELRLILIVGGEWWSASAFFCLVPQHVRRAWFATVEDMKRLTPWPLCIYCARYNSSLDIVPLPDKDTPCRPFPTYP